MRLIILCCASLLCLAPALSSTLTPAPKPANVVQLRKLFVQTFGADFELLSDEVEEGAGGKFWVPTVKATRSGSFTFRYKFQRVNYGYKFSDNEYRVVVGEKGCKRTLFYGFHPDMCVGDSIVLRIQIDNYVTRHSFSKVSRFKTDFSSSYTGMEDMVTGEIDNPLAAHLKLLGRTARASIRRDLRYVSVDYRAVFEAKDPGQFKLQLSALVPDALREFDKKNVGSSHAIPIMIVAGDEPLRTIATEEHIWESDLAPDESYHPQSSSAGGRNHEAGVLMLHTGDKITLSYRGMWLPTREGMETLSLQVKPIIEKLPF
jgi:hypothetical protein